MVKFINFDFILTILKSMNNFNPDLYSGYWKFSIQQIEGRLLSRGPTIFSIHSCFLYFKGFKAFFYKLKIYVGGLIIQLRE